MSTPLKVFFGFIIVLLLGVCVYLGFTYYTESKDTGITTDQAAPTLDPNPTTDLIRVDKSQIKKYLGQVFCIQKMTEGTPLTACKNFGIILEDGKSYELVFGLGLSASKFTELQNIVVVGVISPGSSVQPDTAGMGGILSVAEILE